MSLKVLTVIILKVQKYNKPKLNSEQEIENLEIALISDNVKKQVGQITAKHLISGTKQRSHHILSRLQIKNKFINQVVIGV